MFSFAGVLGLFQHGFYAKKKKLIDTILPDKNTADLTRIIQNFKIG